MKNLYIHGSGVYIHVPEIYRTATGNPKVINCDLYEGHYVLLHKDHPTFSAIYSTLLAAMMSGKSVTYRVNENGACTVAYARVYP